jgi:hypothetical protein
LLLRYSDQFEGYANQVYWCNTPSGVYFSEPICHNLPLVEYKKITLITCNMQLKINISQLNLAFVPPRIQYHVVTTLNLMSKKSSAISNDNFKNLAKLEENASRITVRSFVNQLTLD